MVGSTTTSSLGLRRSSRILGLASSGPEGVVNTSETHEAPRRQSPRKQMHRTHPYQEVIQNCIPPKASPGKGKKSTTRGVSATRKGKVVASKGNGEESDNHEEAEGRSGGAGEAVPNSFQQKIAMINALAFSETDWLTLRGLAPPGTMALCLPVTTPRRLSDLDMQLPRAHPLPECRLPQEVITRIFRSAENVVVATHYDENDDELTKGIMLNAILLPIFGLFEGIIQIQPESKVDYGVSGYLDMKIQTFGDIILIFVELGSLGGRGLLGLCLLFAEMLAVARKKDFKYPIHGILTDVERTHIYVLESRHRRGGDVPMPAFRAVRRLDLNLSRLSTDEHSQSQLKLFCGVITAILFRGLQNAFSRFTRSLAVEPTSAGINTASDIAGEHEPPTGTSESDSRQSIEEWQSAQDKFREAKDAMKSPVNYELARNRIEEGLRIISQFLSPK